MEERHRAGYWGRLCGVSRPSPSEPPFQHLSVFIKPGNSLDPTVKWFLWRFYYVGMIDEIVGHWLLL